MRLVILPRNPDDTVALAVHDFRALGHDYTAKLFKGDALKRVWALLDTPDGRPKKISEQRQQE